MLCYFRLNHPIMNFILKDILDNSKIDEHFATYLIFDLAL